MNILLCHNYYKQVGGEDLSYEDEACMLEQRGHQVHRYSLHNDAIDDMSGWNVARRSLWNRQTYSELRQLIRLKRPDVLHCTNTFPLISPSAYTAARAEGIPVVQSLRNYRLLCPSAFFVRNGRVCEDCLGRATAWPGVLHKCYRDSRSATAMVALISQLQRIKRAAFRSVACYYTPTQFARQKFIQGGFPAERILVKKNFVDPDPGIGTGRGGYAVFAGRLSPEKGIGTLLEAWSNLARDGYPLPLKIVGDGPLAAQARAAAKAHGQIEYLGHLSPRETLALMGDALLLVVPSVWYETFGRTVIEAFACGTPVVASRLGAMAELVEDGGTGLCFTPGNADDLAAKVRALASNAPLLATMRCRARQEYERNYTAEPNYRQLIAIYELAQAGPASG